MGVTDRSLLDQVKAVGPRCDGAALPCRRLYAQYQRDQCLQAAAAMARGVEGDSTPGSPTDTWHAASAVNGSTTRLMTPNHFRCLAPRTTTECPICVCRAEGGVPPEADRNDGSGVDALRGLKRRTREQKADESIPGMWIREGRVLDPASSRSTTAAGARNELPTGGPFLQNPVDRAAHLGASLAPFDAGHQQRVVAGIAVAD